EFSTTIGCQSYGLTVTVLCTACPTGTLTPTPGPGTGTATPTRPPNTNTPTVTPTSTRTPTVQSTSTNTTTSTPAPLTPSATPTLRDVPTTDPYCRYIDTAYSPAIFSGYACGADCLEFRPGNNGTRGQLCKIVVSAKGWPLYTPPTQTFRDVPPSGTFYRYIE